MKIADISCGTGAATLQLARTLNARTTAVDLLPDFIDMLKSRTEHEGLDQQINPLVCSMENLPFDKEEYDVIWSEGAIYNIGFQKGITDWFHFLKPGGKLIVSEITWLTATRPKKIEDYWETQYSEINTASKKIQILEDCGYTHTGYFVLPEHCWLENYYSPLQNQFSSFLSKHPNSAATQAVITEETKEISLY